MTNGIMSIVGALVFIALSSHFRNQPDQYLAIMKHDRGVWNNSGINPTEYGIIFPTKEQEQKFFDQINFTQIDFTQIKASHSFSSVEAEK